MALYFYFERRGVSFGLFDLVGFVVIVVFILKTVT
jgi:hypothetical protein